MQWLIDNIWLVPIYPLVVFFLIMLGRASGLLFKKELSMLLTVGATGVGLAHAVAALYWMFGQGAGHVVPIERNFDWLQAGNFTLSIGYLLDNMSVMMLFVVTFISLLIQIYTHGYMDHDKGYSKFYAYLALFNFSMLGLVLSTNLFQIYMFWELVGVSSYLLIGFWFHKPSAAAAAVKAFLMNRVGDFGLLIGILSFLYFSYSWWNGTYLPAHPEQAMLSFQGFGAAAAHVLETAGPLTFAIIGILIFMGPMAKSAQVPLHTWLPDAMEGPTPISALIHAATMVAAGVYLVGRVYPMYNFSPEATAFVAIIGVLTAVIGATIALTQTDIKKALAYSTMSQLGFMVTAMGVGAFTAGLFHLFTHAFFKAMLFLCSGSVIHACEDEQDMRKMGGLAKKLPVTHITYLIGTAAIAGLWPLSAFWSKDEILVGAQQYSPVIFVALAITAGLTAFYMFRTYFMTFTGSYRGEAHVHHESPVMVTPLAILAIPSLGIGALLSGAIPGVPSFGEYINFAAPGAHHAAEHHITFFGALFSQVGLISTVVAVIGIAAAAAMYGVRAVDPNVFRNAFKPLYNLFTNKWYFDDLYQGFVDRVYLMFARRSSGFDRSVLDGIVNWAGRTTMGSGYLMRELQSGHIQTYVAVLFFGIFILSLVFIYRLL